MSARSPPTSHPAVTPSDVAETSTRAHRWLVAGRPRVGRPHADVANTPDASRPAAPRRVLRAGATQTVDRIKTRAIRLHRLVGDDRGAVLTEYVALMGFVAIATIGALLFCGLAVAHSYFFVRSYLVFPLP